MLDVIEVQLKAPHEVLRVLAKNKTPSNAEAIVDMAVVRRGVDDSFFTTSPVGKYSVGDELQQADRG